MENGAFADMGVSNRAEQKRPFPTPCESQSPVELPCSPVPGDRGAAGPARGDGMQGCSQRGPNRPRGCEVNWPLA